MPLVPTIMPMIARPDALYFMVLTRSVSTIKKSFWKLMFLTSVFIGYVPKVDFCVSNRIKRPFIIIP